MLTLDPTCPELPINVQKYIMIQEITNNERSSLKFMFCNYLLYYTTMECTTINTMHTAKEFFGPFSNMDLIKLKSAYLQLCYST